MKIKHSGAKYSAIVSIGEKLNELEKSSGEKYLRLNRGIPSVTNIDLSEVVKLIDFNSPSIKVYPNNSGIPELKSAINKSFFNNKIDVNNLFVTAGGMNALDLVFKTLDLEKVYLPEFYWGAYANLLRINNIENDTYFSFYDLEKLDHKDSAVIICDPNNPVGNKYNDDMLLELVKKLERKNITVIWDSPYRKIFYEEDDDFYVKLSECKNVILVESFSKSIGLSGQRIGFIHTTDKESKSSIMSLISIYCMQLMELMHLHKYLLLKY